MMDAERAVLASGRGETKAERDADENASRAGIAAFTRHGSRRPFLDAGRELLYVLGETMSSKAAIDHTQTESRHTSPSCHLSP